VKPSRFLNDFQNFKYKRLKNKTSMSNSEYMVFCAFRQGWQDGRRELIRQRKAKGAKYGSK